MHFLFRYSISIRMPYGSAFICIYLLFQQLSIVIMVLLRITAQTVMLKVIQGFHFGIRAMIHGLTALVRIINTIRIMHILCFGNCVYSNTWSYYSLTYIVICMICTHMQICIYIPFAFFVALFQYDCSITYIYCNMYDLLYSLTDLITIYLFVCMHFLFCYSAFVRMYLFFYQSPFVMMVQMVPHLSVWTVTMMVIQEIQRGMVLYGLLVMVRIYY